ncbi:MAG: alpha-1,4-glucan--maltose-1-phosphate maltosyltransferase [Candidatus Dormibacteraeota bacterium]|nr:alpha-1,4-glucan--maltose-1-phosphate maltosyltransferase [Candidatus Dormibacteraeota bacterium]
MDQPDVETRRVVIEGVTPQVEAGRYPAKASLGESIRVEADCFADGHDQLGAMLLHRRAGEPGWVETSMVPLLNDRWRGEFVPGGLGVHCFTVESWIDHFASWARDLAKRVEAKQDVAVDLLAGALLVEQAAERAGRTDATVLRAAARKLRATGPRSTAGAIKTALSPELQSLVARHPDRSYASRYAAELEVAVDPALARFSSWYEMFPRSTGPAGRHGTFKSTEERLPYVAGMGFNVLYLPPIHPIGRTHRKGKNNSVGAEPDDVGSPWAIGSELGGHKSVNPDLGTLEDFRHLVTAARAAGLETALDIAFQCSPDHPYVREHPDWFKHRPDGSIQYAENPPKKYQDIYPFDFETPAWRELWEELLSVFLFWAEQGVRVFRVDNPHTKPFPFWEWLMPELKQRHPDAITLSEAFTRPKVMYQLAKVGFSQSYTYFAWRNQKAELREYFTELTTHPVRDFFRPNLWPNTPDILTDFLQHGGRAAFIARLVLAATLGASYGIYGPAFEHCESLAIAAGKEEYYNSEKYQLREWRLARPESLGDFISRVNSIRRDNPALQTDRGLRFVDVDNENLIAYSKVDEGGSNLLLMVVNLDPYHTQAGMIDVPIHRWGIEADAQYQVHDLIADARYSWRNWKNYVELNPYVQPAHIFRVQHRIRDERDFDQWQ